MFELYLLYLEQINENHPLLNYRDLLLPPKVLNIIYGFLQLFLLLLLFFGDFDLELDVYLLACCRNLLSHHIEVC